MGYPLTVSVGGAVDQCHIGAPNQDDSGRLGITGYTPNIVAGMPTLRCPPMASKELYSAAYLYDATLWECQAGSFENDGVESVHVRQMMYQTCFF